MNCAEIAIIGTGPAGVSAALNARIRHKQLILFGSGELSGKVQCSQRIENYPGLGSIGGPALNARLAEQLREQGISVTEKRITGIYPMGNYFALLANQEEFHAKTVILTTGVEAARPIPGERELLGRGVSYCATCDGNLYRGRRIAVLCDSPELEPEVDYLAGLAERVYYRPLFQGSRYTRENVERLPSPVVRLLGTRRVSGLLCRDGRELALDGVFFLKQSVSPVVLLQGLAMEGSHVSVNRHMATNIPGCFAAGDCTGAPYQIAKAVGEGNIAAHSAIEYLAKCARKG